MQTMVWSPYGSRWGLLLLLLCIQYSTAWITKGELPEELQVCYNRHANVSLHDVVGHTVCWCCETPAVARFRAENMPAYHAPSTSGYVEHLVERLNNQMTRNRAKRQTRPPCVRKEYRMLTDGERRRYHNAINTLKRSGRYDEIATLHSPEIFDSAHGGPAFLSWHRYYLNVYEMALQDVDASICLPYWDSSLDNELRRPWRSYVFSPAFLGGPRGTTNPVSGPVVDGPFANYRTPLPSAFQRLTRAIGINGDLFDISDINSVLSQISTRDIIRTFENRFGPSILEGHHDAVHVYVGGNMQEVYSPQDPTFFLHHCFVDYIWEVFRYGQRRAGIDPETDYPPVTDPPTYPPEHNPDRRMLFPNNNLTNAQGFLDSLTDGFIYESSPTCIFRRRGCGSRYLRCNRRNRCVPRNLTPRETLDSPVAFSRAFGSDIGSERSTAPATGRTLGLNLTPDTGMDPAFTSASGDEESSLGRVPPTAIQNSYCIDGKCDTREWVYIPVEVVSVRSPDVKTYPSYPVYNGSIWKYRDIYDTSSPYSSYHSSSPYSFTYNVNRDPKCYHTCERGNGIGQIYIQSSGLNYIGMYKESVIIDQRLDTSMAVGFVAVKNPEKGPVRALFRAYDSCGRICNTIYRTPGTRKYEPFSGVLNIEDIPGWPKQYSRTYGEATMKIWRKYSNQKCPSLSDNDVVLSFHCDYSDRLPWINFSQHHM